MSNQLENKQRTLAQILAANRLTKIAGDQKIEHCSVKSQDDLGAEQEAEAKDMAGAASVQAPSAKGGEPIQNPPNDAAGIGCSFKNLSRTGTKVEVMDQKGNAADLPKQASAEAYRVKLAGIMKMMDKRAAAENTEFTTATEIMNKIASLGDQASDDQIDELNQDLCKLAATNPLFNEYRDHVIMSKMAEDIEALAEAEGISPEEAADLMDQAVEADPSIQEDLENEATADAVEGLANAEAEGAEFSDDISAMAANASDALGVDVQPEDILDAIDEVEAQAEEMGVPPEALIQAAAEELQAQNEVTPEDEEAAQAILDEAAANGISPDEVIQMAMEQLGGEGEPEEEASEEAPADGEEKTASVRAATDRAAYVQSLIDRS